MTSHPDENMTGMNLGDERAPVLEYRHRPMQVELPSPWKTVSLRLGLSCWLIPLVSGLMTGALYFEFRAEWLLFCGAAVILLGTLAACIGGCCALFFIFSRWGPARHKFKEAIVPAIYLLLLLGSNFVVAGVMVSFVNLSGDFN